MISKQFVDVQVSYEIYTAGNKINTISQNEYTLAVTRYFALRFWILETTNIPIEKVKKLNCQNVKFIDFRIQRVKNGTLLLIRPSVLLSPGYIF